MEKEKLEAANQLTTDIKRLNEDLKAAVEYKQQLSGISGGRLFLDINIQHFLPEFMDPYIENLRAASVGKEKEFLSL